MAWTLQTDKKKIPKLKKPVLIVGLPGIGNVGKIAVDFLIDSLDAQKFGDLFSPTLPNSVFVNEDDLVELPRIEVFVKRFKDARPDLVLIAGDVQPTEEADSYGFAHAVLDMFGRMGGKELITIGGIGLQKIPTDPRVLVAGNNKEILARYRKGTSIVPHTFGTVGPVIGCAGLLVGLAPEYGIPAIALLAETFAHPFYVGINGSEAVIDILNAKLHLHVDLKELRKEIKAIENDLHSRTEQLKSMQKGYKKTETSYIG